MKVIDIYTLRRCNFLAERRFRSETSAMKKYNEGELKNEYNINTNSFSTE